MLLIWLLKEKLFWTLENLQGSAALKNWLRPDLQICMCFIIPNCLNLMFVQETEFVFLIVLTPLPDLKI